VSKQKKQQPDESVPSMCRKCWDDAGALLATGVCGEDSVTQVYHRLLFERERSGNRCTLEQQRGSA
jgi:hypothetical protein